jgi:hypothetical protein
VTSQMKKPEGDERNQTSGKWTIFVSTASKTRVKESFRHFKKISTLQIHSVIKCTIRFFYRVALKCKKMRCVANVLSFQIKNAKDWNLARSFFSKL